MINEPSMIIAITLARTSCTWFKFFLKTFFLVTFALNEFSFKIGQNEWNHYILFNLFWILLLRMTYFLWRTSRSATYVLWNSVICLKLPNIKSLLSDTIFGALLFSTVLIYFSTTRVRSRPNSSSVSTSSRTTALF